MNASNRSVNYRAQGEWRGEGLRDVWSRTPLLQPGASAVSMATGK